MIKVRTYQDFKTKWFLLSVLTLKDMLFPNNSVDLFIYFWLFWEILLGEYIKVSMYLCIFLGRSFIVCVRLLEIFCPPAPKQMKTMVLGTLFTQLTFMSTEIFATYAKYWGVEMSSFPGGVGWVRQTLRETPSKFCIKSSWVLFKHRGQRNWA